jgi:hypothetical protein
MELAIANIAVDRLCPEIRFPCDITSPQKALFSHQFHGWSGRAYSGKPVEL